VNELQLEHWSYLDSERKPGRELLNTVQHTSVGQ